MSKDARRKEKKAAESAKAEPKVEAKAEPKVEAKAEPKVKAEPKAKRMTVADLTEICRTLAEATKECKVDLRDHEDRICKLEKEVFGSEPVSEPEPKPEPKPVSEPEPKPEPKPAPELKPEPDPVPKMPRPVSKIHGSAPVGEGLGIAFRYWHEPTHSWCIGANEISVCQLSNGVYQAIWAWYNADGTIHHILSRDEVLKYAP